MWLDAWQGGVGLGLELGGVWGGPEGVVVVVGGHSVHNKWQFSVWSGWLPSTGPLDCWGLLGGLWAKAEEEDE